MLLTYNKKIYNKNKKTYCISQKLILEKSFGNFQEIKND